MNERTDTRRAPGVAPAVLARSRRLVDPVLVATLQRLHPDIRRAAAYHLGFEEADGAPADGSGKRIRPALAVLSAEAVGSDAAVGVPGAVAVELVHNFSLLHDDIIDGDRERRHRPTVWALFGVGQAIIVGDALQTVAHQWLLETATAAAPAAGRLLADAVAEMIAGQAEDIALESDESIDVERCVRMAGAKTGALLSCAASIGAVLAGADSGATAALARFGAEVGLSFQAVDDILGIWGDPTVTGKPVGADLAAKKKTLPVAFATSTDAAAREELAAAFRNGALDEEAVRRATAVVERAGGRDATEEFARAHLAAALTAVEEAGLDPGPTDELVQVARYICERHQ
jgi:geranylgeranyl diphosphate synthase type I